MGAFPVRAARFVGLWRGLYLQFGGRCIPPSSMAETILITGGAGFIGSHVVDVVLAKEPACRVVVLDSLSYSGFLGNLVQHTDNPRFAFVKGDIQDGPLVDDLFQQHQPTRVYHLAAESHVDKSIVAPLAFVHTNVVGTATLLNACLKHWDKSAYAHNRFLHVSTDEVYGALGPEGQFTETTAYDPRSPYSASKAGSDHLVRAYSHTYGLPTIITNCSNNYGPRQHPEKLIPLAISNLLEGKPLPVYGTGTHVRDWLWVTEHAQALHLVAAQGTPGETYLIGGNNERSNIEVVHMLCAIADEVLGKDPGTSEKLIQYVTDRPGHDFRYALDTQKIAAHLGWQPTVAFADGLRQTFSWYLHNPEWLAAVKSGEYASWYELQYGARPAFQPKG